MKGFIFSLLFLLGFLSFIKAPPPTTSKEIKDTITVAPEALPLPIKMRAQWTLFRETDFELTFENVALINKQNQITEPKKTETTGFKKILLPLG